MQRPLGAWVGQTHKCRPNDPSNLSPGGPAAGWDLGFTQRSTTRDRPEPGSRLPVNRYLLNK